jgi:TonB family protein
VSLRSTRMWLGGALLAGLATTVLFPPVRAVAQEELITLKIKSKVTPNYPELAHRMSIVGKVKLAVVVAPNGSVRDARVIGGHPILANAALDAVKKWKYEPTSHDTAGMVEVTFARP